MKSETVKIYSQKSIAGLVLGSKMPRWRKWLLRKLMPADFWEMPPQELMKLQKGAVIGGVTIHLDAVSSAPASIDLGVKKSCGGL